MLHPFQYVVHQILHSTFLIDDPCFSVVVIPVFPNVTVPGDFPELVCKTSGIPGVIVGIELFLYLFRIKVFNVQSIIIIGLWSEYVRTLIDRLLNGQFTISGLSRFPVPFVPIQRGGAKNFIHFSKISVCPKCQVIRKRHISFRLRVIELFPSTIHKELKAHAVFAVRCNPYDVFD